jgi:hypothetical protein
VTREGRSKDFRLSLLTLRIIVNTQTHSGHRHRPAARRILPWRVVDSMQMDPIWWQVWCFLFCRAAITEISFLWSSIASFLSGFQWPRVSGPAVAYTDFSAGLYLTYGQLCSGSTDASTVTGYSASCSGRCGPRNGAYLRGLICSGRWILRRGSSPGSRESAVGIATGCGLDDWRVGVRVPVGASIFSSPRRPDRVWGPPSLLSNGYWGLFSRGWSWHFTSI